MNKRKTNTSEINCKERVDQGFPDQIVYLSELNIQTF